MPRRSRSRRSLLAARCIVTGASSGIGAALAASLLLRGARVLITARRNERLQALIEAHPTEAARGDLVSVCGDITDGHTQAELLHVAQQQWGGLDVLINNAGIGTLAPFRESTDDDFRRLLEVNLLAAAALTRQALPRLKQGQSPLIVNIGSVLGHFPVPFKSEYCASKYALRGWNDALRMELRRDGIEVLLVNPSTTQSEFFEKAIRDTTGINWLRFGAMTPDRVADLTCRAMERRRAEINLSRGGVWLVRLHRWFPRTTQRLLSRDAARSGPR